MRLEIDNWHLAYSQIVADCRENEGSSCLILCHADVDAMAAARIWTYMLRADGVSYQLLPCSNYAHLAQLLSSSASVVQESVRSVLLLNLGATRNLSRLLFGPRGGGQQAPSDDDEDPTSLPPLPPILSASAKVFVVDCRRPVHLTNLYAGDNVVVLWNGEHQQATIGDLPSDGDNMSGDESSSSSDSSDDDDGEESNTGDDDEGEYEFQDEMDHRPPTGQASTVGLEQESDYDGDREEDEGRKRPRTRGTDAVESRDADDDESLDDDRASMGDSDDDRNPKPTLATAPTATTLDTAEDEDEPRMPSSTPRELHKQRRERLRAYYSSGCFYGAPAAFVAYRVATQLRFGDVGDLLWLACVGVTDAYLHARVDVSGYTSFAMDLRSHCSRLFPNDMYHRVETSVFAERLDGSDRELTKIAFSENGRVLSETDFRFFLLRHSSLFDAMVYSDFVSTKFQLLTSRGMHRLRELLATMGYPLEECHQPFAFMKPSLRRRLADQIRLHSEAYGLENFEFTSFFRVTGYQSLLSASDTSYAVTALLECDRPSNKSEEDADLEAFNVAYDALNSNAAPPSVSMNGAASLTNLVNGASLSSSGLGAGIRLAMLFQKSILSTAASLIDRSAITRLSHFRYAYITCTSAGHDQQQQQDRVAEDSTAATPHHVFAKPLALTRLAHYLMDLHRENGKWVGAKARPLVLCAEKPPRSYLVAGFEYPESAGHFVVNRFGKNFELAATSMQGTFRLDGFDSHVVEVAASDVQRFIEQLHYLMESSVSSAPDFTLE